MPRLFTGFYEWVLGRISGYASVFMIKKSMVKNNFYLMGKNVFIF